MRHTTVELRYRRICSRVYPDARTFQREKVRRANLANSTGRPLGSRLCPLRSRQEDRLFHTVPIAAERRVSCDMLSGTCYLKAAFAVPVPLCRAVVRIEDEFGSCRKGVWQFEALPGFLPTLTPPVQVPAERHATRHLRPACASPSWEARAAGGYVRGTGPPHGASSLPAALLCTPG